MAEMRHVGDMPQDTSKEGHRSTFTFDSMGKTMQQEPQQNPTQKQPAGSNGMQPQAQPGQQPDSVGAAQTAPRAGGNAAVVGAAGGTDASAGASMAGGPALHGGGAPGGTATAGTSEPQGTATAGGGSPAAGAGAAGGTGLGGADINGGAGDTRIVPENPNPAASGTSMPGGTGVSSGRSPT